MSTATELPALEVDYTPGEVAQALRKSERWLRNRIRAGEVEHTRRGNKITFTKAQVDRLRAEGAVTPTTAPVTTGRKRS